MSKIVNEARIKNKLIVKIRELLEHRAFWLYLLVDEAEKRGLDPEEFASAAITRCGISQGTDLQKKSGTKSLKGLRKTLFTRAARWVFEMDLVEIQTTRSISISTTARWSRPGRRPAAATRRSPDCATSPCAATTASAAALTHALSCPRPLRRAMTSAR